MEIIKKKNKEIINNRKKNQVRKIKIKIKKNQAKKIKRKKNLVRRKRNNKKIKHKIKKKIKTTNTLYLVMANKFLLKNFLNLYNNSIRALF